MGRKGRPAEVQVTPDGCLIRVLDLAVCAFLQASEAIESHVLKAIPIAHLQDTVSCDFPSSMQ